MRQGLRLALLVGLALPMFGGCAKQLTRIESRIDEVSVEQRRTAREVEQLSQALARIDEREAEREESVIERRAELQVQLETLDRVVRQMDARAEEQEALLRRISAALDLLAREPGAGSRAGASPPATGDSLAEDGSTNPDESNEVLEGSPGTDVFDAAFSDYTRGRYALARDGFQELIDRFPGSELIDDASYWVAETWYGEGDYERALAGFESVVREYPRSDVVAPALLKWGYSLVETNDIEGARQVLTRLVADHPGSDEALIAEHRLSSLDESP